MKQNKNFIYQQNLLLNNKLEFMEQIVFMICSFFDIVKEKEE